MYYSGIPRRVEEHIQVGLTHTYSFPTWMGASESSLKQLDRVQYRALRLIGPGVVLRHLSHRRMIGALCYMYKLHCIPPSHPVASLLPGPAVVAPNPRTRRSSIACHPHQLQQDHPARTASWNLLRFPNAASKAWNVLPPSLLQHRPELKRMQAFKGKIKRHLLQFQLASSHGQSVTFYFFYFIILL